jgi:hypothetical protein
VVYLLDKKICLRCNIQLQNDEVDLCKECDGLIEKAVDLVKNNPEVSKYFEDIQRKQREAEVRLDKLKHLYYNGKTEGGFLRKTGKKIIKFYRLNALDAGINAMKKIFNPDLNDKPNEEDLLVGEIIELEQFVSTEPIEFVIHKYLISSEENKEENKEDTSKKNNFFKETIDYFVNDKFLKLNKEKQVKTSLVFVIVVSILMLCISFL